MMRKLLCCALIGGTIVLAGTKLTEAGNGPLPDLVVTGMSIELETGGFCGFTSTALGIAAHIANQGNSDAGPFAVDINGTQVMVAGLAAGANSTVWATPYVWPGDNTVTIDSTSMVAESNEGNNDLTQAPPIPTLPQTCTPTPTPTTPAAPPTETPEAAPTSTSADIVAPPDVGDGKPGGGLPQPLFAGLAALAGLAIGAAATARLRGSARG